MCDVPWFVIGHETSDHVKVTILGRSRPDCTDYWDGKWVDADLSVKAGGFSGNVRASLRTDEFVPFRDQFAGLYHSLDGIAEFASMESWLTLTINGDGLGHFTARCEVQDDASFRNRLNFDLHFDQTEIPPILRQLDSIMEAFPIIGDRGT